MDCLWMIEWKLILAYDKRLFSYPVLDCIISSSGFLTSFYLFFLCITIRRSALTGECGEPTYSWDWARCWWLPDDQWWECPRWLSLPVRPLPWWADFLSRKCLSHHGLVLFSDGLSVGIDIQRAHMADILIRHRFMEATWPEATWIQTATLAPKVAATCVKVHEMLSSISILTLIKTNPFVVDRRRTNEPPNGRWLKRQQSAWSILSKRGRLPLWVTTGISTERELDQLIRLFSTDPPGGGYGY